MRTFYENMIMKMTHESYVIFYNDNYNDIFLNKIKCKFAENARLKEYVILLSYSSYMS